jgi:predicted P-loop ATPase
MIERTCGRWIIEAAELHRRRGRETEDIKASLSRQCDGPVRLAYGRYSTTVPRQFVIMGTTNHQSHYLKDMTGARRYWPVALDAIDLAALEHDRDQLWAEAVAREPNTVLHLPMTLWKDAEAEQEARRAADPWEETIEPFLSDGLMQTTRVASAEIWKALGVEANQRNNQHADRVAAIMERNHYKKQQDTEGRMTWVRQ